jgi:hypothetical protein
VALVAASALLGLVLRGAIFFGTLGEIDADQAIVGLMALGILDGERPAFYWVRPMAVP